MPKDAGGKSSHAFVDEGKLTTFEPARRPGEKPKYVFKGEAEILKELKFLVDKQKKRKIYVLQGNGEVTINDDTPFYRRDFTTELGGIGIGMLVDRLTRDNYDVVGLSFEPELPAEKSKNIVHLKEGADKKKDVPEDCDTLIVAGVAKKLDTKILDAIERYMQRGGPDKNGGKMLVFLDVFVDPEANKLKNSGIEDLLKNYGVEVTNEFALQVPVGQAGDPRSLVATTPRASEHALAKQFSGRSIVMKRSARVLRPSEMPQGRYKAETVLEHPYPSSERRFAIVEKDVRILKNPVGFLQDLNKKDKLGDAIEKKPIPLAVAVSEMEGTPRLVVFGDTEFITNAELYASSTRDHNYDFTASAIEWMAGRDFIGPRPRESEAFRVDPDTKDRFWRMVLLPGWFMFLGFISLGISIWVVRRR
jgi:hypothetical protein